MGGSPGLEAEGVAASAVVMSVSRFGKYIVEYGLEGSMRNGR